MTKTTLNRLQLELHVPSFDKVLDFYGKLGFHKVMHRNAENNPQYLVMEKGGTIINFWSGNDSVYKHSYFKNFPKDSKRGYGVEIIVTVDNIESSFETAKKFAKVLQPLVLKPWGLKDFRIEDPFGYYLRITEDYDILDPGYAVNKGQASSDHT